MALGTAMRVASVTSSSGLSQVHAAGAAADDDAGGELDPMPTGSRIWRARPAAVRHTTVASVYRDKSETSRIKCTLYGLAHAYGRPVKLQLFTESFSDRDFLRTTRVLQSIHSR